MGCPYGQGDAPQELDRVRALGYRCGPFSSSIQRYSIYRYIDELNGPHSWRARAVPSSQP